MTETPDAMTDCSIRVPLPALRQALKAVLPHAEPTKVGDEVTAFQRVRLSADRSELFVMATSGATSALAAVPIEGGSDSRAERFEPWDGPFEIDLSPSTVRRIRQVFPCREANADGEYDVVQLDMTPDAIMISDASGLFVEILGQALRVSCLPYSSDYPNLRDALAKALGAAGESQTAKPLVSTGGMFALFNHAATAYRMPLTYEGTGPKESRGFIVWCGPSFIGHVSSQHNDDDSLAKRDAYRRKHMERLGLQPALELV